MKVKVKAENCTIKVYGYFHDYNLSFSKGDVLEIEIEDGAIITEKEEGNEYEGD